jgi:hypothetical protein
MDDDFTTTNWNTPADHTELQVLKPIILKINHFIAK